MCLWYFYFEKVHGPTPLIFYFTGFSAIVPNGLIEVQAPLFRLLFLGDPSHARSVRPWCALTSITSPSSVVKNKEYGRLNTVNCDVSTDNIFNTVDTRGIISRVKPDFLSQLKSVAPRAD